MKRKGRKITKKNKNRYSKLNKPSWFFVIIEAIKSTPEPKTNDIYKNRSIYPIKVKYITPQKEGMQITHSVSGLNISQI